MKFKIGDVVRLSKNVSSKSMLGVIVNADTICGVKWKNGMFDAYRETDLRRANIYKPKHDDYIKIKGLSLEQQDALRSRLLHLGHSLHSNQTISDRYEYIKYEDGWFGSNVDSAYVHTTISLHEIFSGVIPEIIDVDDIPF